MSAASVRRSPASGPESRKYAPKEVDDAQWATLQQDLIRGYEALSGAIEANGISGTALAAAAHLAYHIGAIRQKIAAARA